MKRRAHFSPGNVLIASDNGSDATLIKRLLASEFAVVNTSIDPDRAVEDFERYLPQVLVLAFNRIENSEQYYLGLFRGDGGKVHTQAHRSILLCDKDELQRAYQLCQRKLFDDYNLFWPMAQDPHRLPMSVHMALREMNGAGMIAPEAAGLVDAAPALPVILVVDDDEIEHRLIGAILKDEHYRLIYVSSALEALIVLRTVRPDLILMDVLMPDMDGMTATRQIKAVPQFAGVPVIMITGNSETSVVMDSYNSGATDFVVKPFEREKLIARVASGLRHGKTARLVTPA